MTLVSCAAIVSVASCTSTSWPHDQFSAPTRELGALDTRSLDWFDVLALLTAFTDTRILRPSYPFAVPSDLKGAP